MIQRLWMVWMKWPSQVPANLASSSGPLPLIASTTTSKSSTLRFEANHTMPYQSQGSEKGMDSTVEHEFCEWHLLKSPDSKPNTWQYRAQYENTKKPWELLLFFWVKMLHVRLYWTHIHRRSIARVQSLPWFENNFLNLTPTSTPLMAGLSSHKLINVWQKEGNSKAPSGLHFWQVFLVLEIMSSRYTL